MVESILKDDDVFMQELQDYLHGEDNDIAQWNKQYGGDEGIITTDGATMDRETLEELGATFSPAVNPATGAAGPHPAAAGQSSQVLRQPFSDTAKPDNNAAATSVTDEAAVNKELYNLRALGKKTGKERLALMTQNGKSIGSWQGGKDSITITGKIENILLKQPDNSVINMHNHPGSTSFSKEDLSVMCSYKSIKEMRVVGHNGKVYTMTIGNGRRVTLEQLENYEKVIYNKAYEEVARKAVLGIRTNFYSERNRLFAEEFGWTYKEGALNGKK
jgi:hypothetical protein